MCDTERLRLHIPQLYQALSEELVAHSSEALEICHSALARSRGYRMKFRQVRTHYRAITPTLARSVILKKTFLRGYARTPTRDGSRRLTTCHSARAANARSAAA